MKTTITIMFFASFFCNAQSSGLIKNGSFEAGLENWTGDAAVITSYDFKQGKKAMMINQFVGKEWKAIDQIITIPKNAHAIQFSGWIKTTSVEGGKELWNKALVALEFRTGNKGVSNANVIEVGGTTEWKEFKKAVLVPPGVNEVRLMLALAQTSGTLLCDGLKAVALSEEEYLKLVTPLAKHE